MKFKEAEIKLMGNNFKALPGTVPGYRSGVWTIHGSVPEGWIISVGGVRVTCAKKISKAKAACKKLAALPAPWDKGPSALIAAFAKDKAMRDQAAEIRSRCRF